MSKRSNDRFIIDRPPILEISRPLINREWKNSLKFVLETCYATFDSSVRTFVFNFASKMAENGNEKREGSRFERGRNSSGRYNRRSTLVVHPTGTY